MILRYRHFEALYRMGDRYVEKGQLNAQDFDAQHKRAFDTIAREFLLDHENKVDSFFRFLLSRFFRWIHPFELDLPLGDQGIRAYYQFRRWIKWRVQRV